MNDRILVTYATRAGSTAEVAAAIAETLAARGYAVDVKSVEADHRGWDEIRQWANAVEV